MAVTVDDGEAGVTEVVRGSDLLSSAPRQMYLQELFGSPHPIYAHVPMLLAPDGRRLSKRDRDLDLGSLRKTTTPEAILGTRAYACGLLDRREPASAKELASIFTWDKIKKAAICLPAASVQVSHHGPPPASRGRAGCILVEKPLSHRHQNKVSSFSSNSLSFTANRSIPFAIP